MIPKVRVLRFGDPLREQEVVRVARPQAFEQPQRPGGVVLVPEIDLVELVVRLPADERPARARPLHLCESLGAVAPGQQQQPAKQSEDRGCNAGVVMIEAHAEVRVLKRLVETEGAVQSILGALAVPRRRQLVASQDAPLSPVRVCRAEIEPGFGPFGFTGGPLFGRRDSVGHACDERLVERPVVGVHLDLPPEGHSAEEVAGGSRARWARLAQFATCPVELRVEDRIVDPGESPDVGESRSWNSSADQGRCGENHDRPGDSPGHRIEHRGQVRVVRSRCFSACRSRASAISRSISAG